MVAYELPKHVNNPQIRFRQRRAHQPVLPAYRLLPLKNGRLLLPKYVNNPKFCIRQRSAHEPALPVYRLLLLQNDHLKSA